MSFEANYVLHAAGRREENACHNANLSYNPATGANYPLHATSAARPFPDWGVVNFELLEGWSNYHGTDFTFTKRFSHRWQATATYTLAHFKDACRRATSGTSDRDGIVARRPIGFALAPDLGGDIHAIAGRDAISATGRSSTASGTSACGCPGERDLLLRLGRALCTNTGVGPARRRRRRRRTLRGCAPTARSCRATRSSAIRSTAWTCGSRSGLPLGGRHDRSTACSRCSTCSTTRTTARTRPTRATPGTGSRRSTATSPISRGCCSSDSGSGSDRSHPRQQERRRPRGFFRSRRRAVHHGRTGRSKLVLG